MSPPLVLGCLWVLAATVTALLPMRRQMATGLALLAAAPVLLVWIGAVHGAAWAGLGLLAFGSMFRRPLWHLAQRAAGQRPELPAEMRGLDERGSEGGA